LKDEDKSALYKKSVRTAL